MKTSTPRLLTSFAALLALFVAAPPSRAQAPGTVDALDANVVGYPVWATAVQADGKTIIAGGFTSVLGVPRNNIARLNADGSLDMGFDPNTDSNVWNVVVQADGKILLGGWFSTLQPNGAATPTVRPHLARVNADGSLDTGFAPGVNSDVYGVALQADGKIVVGGFFTTLQPNGAATPTARQYVARVNADGSLDTGFDPRANGPVLSMAVQADGKVLLGGDFTTLQPNGAASTTTRWRIARVNAGGTLDTSFDPRANDIIRSVAVQADVKVLLGGEFTTLQPNGAASPTTRNHFARLHSDPATQTLSAPDSSEVLWQRGGAAPEVSRVTIERSTDGGANWTPLGAGARIGTTANWQFTGLALSGTGQLRARGATTGGYNNGSSGLIEQVATFTVISTDADNDGLLDSWELAWWPTTAGHGPGDDFDHDGLTELEELAFGLNPTIPDIAAQPPVVEQGGYLTILIVKSPGVTYEVQSAGTLLDGQPDSFSPATTTILLDDATTLKVRDNFPIATSPARFLRIKVVAAP